MYINKARLQMNSPDFFKSENQPFSKTPIKNQTNLLSPNEIWSHYSNLHREHSLYNHNRNNLTRPSITFKKIAKNLEFPEELQISSSPKPYAPSSFSISPSKSSTRKYTLKFDYSPVILPKEIRFSIRLRSQERQSIKRAAKLKPLVRRLNEKPNPEFLTINRLTAVKRGERKIKDVIESNFTEIRKSNELIIENEDLDCINQDVISISDYIKPMNEI